MNVKISNANSIQELCDKLRTVCPNNKIKGDKFFVFHNSNTFCIKRIVGIDNTFDVSLPMHVGLNILGTVIGVVKTSNNTKLNSFISLIGGYTKEGEGFSNKEDRVDQMSEDELEHDFGEWDMVFVEGGSFQATLGDTSDDGREIIVNKDVDITSFYIGRYPVTREQWFSVMEGKPCETDENLPVEQVSWEDSQAFIKRLNEQTGKKFRLPTATEWEYAAKGGRKSKGYQFSGSNNADEVAWYSSNSDNRTHDIGTKQPNELEIYDMSGNVWEWCEDRWGNFQNLPTYGGRQILLKMKNLMTMTGNKVALEEI